MTGRSDVPQDLLERFLRGDRLALARILTLIENGTDGGRELYDALFGRAGGAYRVGITGPPGAGKSTLVRELAQAFRRREQTVGIVAVDPTSPITGGALLGDRVRMPGFVADRGIYMRSMATRGSLGGIARTTAELADVLDAFGHQVVFVETIGVGQIEVEVTRVCHSIVVVLVPESGDAIQAMKAGLLEVAHILVINKADRPGADTLLGEIREALSLRSDRGPWREPLLTTVATEGRGVEELVEALDTHRRHLEAAGLLAEHRRRAARERIATLVEEEMHAAFWRVDGRERGLRELAERVVSGRISPRGAAKELLKQ
jgi:LAO/AO transport system kinase